MTDDPVMAALCVVALLVVVLVYSVPPALRPVVIGHLAAGIPLALQLARSHGKPGSSEPGSRAAAEAA